MAEADLIQSFGVKRNAVSLHEPTYDLPFLGKPTPFTVLTFVTFTE